MDSKPVDNLIRALQYELHTYNKLLEIAQKKTDILVKDDTVLLSSISEEENQLVDQTRQLGKVREQLLIKICEDLGLDGRSVTLDNLKMKVSDPQQLQLSAIQNKLKEAVNKLIVRNGINQKLIENALKYIQFNLELIASPAPEVPSYGRTGQEVSTKAKRSMVDIRY